ncbi:lytic polysaccharide monooxygenase [Trichoderma harzianum CBS 226.95]|uniref:Lytic polysaccharide monooxygenase n=1 Tax=Trichoderma harzianum CBS 226.95 TaxID=983964 RepID=A0A2T4AMC6_TRIHA|nr:lytic polysaccharide monooxygenase [Trichoderma harzianum CBS 226.95]PTB58226.1 lytic polysaccharide monooxygenase [Trichoderma harzianum CBS 226.95]
MFSKLFTITALASAVSAHITMTNPVPYGLSSLNNSPLDPNGADFPCKQRTGVYDLQGASNVYAQGSTQKLSFAGTAVHGGGSCQVSVTTDAQPDKNSVWKVIKSIEGGCPAKDQAGNMGDSASATDPYTYDFTIPKELESGNYTLAWTWFNKVGNREMYMNCAPLSVTGSGGSKDFLNTLPDMFEGNIFGPGGCGTASDTDLLFPNPGNDVDQFNGATSAFLGPTSCSSATVAPTPKPSNGGGSGSGSGSSPVTSAPAQPTKAPQSIPGGPASQPAPSKPTSAPLVNLPVQSQAPVATSAAPAPAPAPTSGSGSSPSGGFAAGTACSSEGQWNCIGGSQFQRCASGAWSPAQALASGTKCQAGQSDNLNMVAKRGSNSMRRAIRIRA